MVVYLNKVDQMDDEELLDLVELEVRELLSVTTSSPATTSRSSAARRLHALESDSTDTDADEYESIKELMEAVDEYVPTPPRPVDQPFLMPIEDVFGIKGRGTVATGRIERGVVNSVAKRSRSSGSKTPRPLS